MAAFTTRQVLEGAPILRVSHETDGAWQFLCETTTDLADVKIVRLEELVKLDATLNDLYELNYGWSAGRNTKESTWQTEESKPKDGFSK